MKIVQNFGAGTQSVGLMLMALDGKFDSCPDHFVFADTGAEPKHVYEYLEMFSEYIWHKYWNRVVIVKEGNLRNDIVNLFNGTATRASSLPLFTKNGGMIRRQCTQDYKIKPIEKWIKKNYEIGRKTKKNNQPIIEQWFGVSLDEIERCKISQNWWTVFKYPLVEARMYRHEVINYVTKYHDLPEPPRSSCSFCSFHSDRYWQFLKDDYPDEFSIASEIDVMIRQLPKLNNETFLHRSCKPLTEVDFSNKGQLEIFPECDGYCGV